MLADLPPGGDPNTPLARARRVHRACERFEADWRNGGQPQLEHFLDAVGPEDRAHSSASCSSWRLNCAANKATPPAPPNTWRGSPTSRR